MLPIEKLAALQARHEELESLLCEPAVLTDAKRYTALSKERAEIDEVVIAYRRYRETSRRLAEDRAALADPELRQMVEDEIPGLERELAGLEEALNALLLPKDPKDARNTVLEIRSGTG